MGRQVNYNQKKRKKKVVLLYSMCVISYKNNLTTRDLVLVSEMMW